MTVYVLYYWDEGVKYVEGVYSKRKLAENKMANWWMGEIEEFVLDEE